MRPLPHFGPSARHPLTCTCPCLATRAPFDSERANKAANAAIHLADVLSPISRKKTGRAYVALARSQSQKCVSFSSSRFVLILAQPSALRPSPVNLTRFRSTLTLRRSRNNLKVALDLYRKAESYVPDNVKLRERSAS